MKIKIKDNASSLYISNCVHNSQPYRKDFASMLETIQEQIIEVETKFLFKDQFNTVPIPGVSETGLRIMIQSVEKIFDDARKDKIKCHYCGQIYQNGQAVEKAKGKSTSDIMTFCPKCQTERTFDNLAWAAYCQNR